MCVRCDREPVPVTTDPYKSALAALADDLVKGISTVQQGKNPGQIICKSDALPLHTIGSRRDCYECARTRDNAR